MTARTFNELFEPPITLTLAMTGGGYVVRDQQGRYYVLVPSTLQFCLRLMKAMSDKGDATIDDASVEMATWQAAQHSVRVGALPERGFAVEAGRTDLTGDITGSDHVPVPPRSESASNVYRLRPAENERTAS